MVASDHATSNSLLGGTITNRIRSRFIVASSGKLSNRAQGLRDVVESRFGGNCSDRLSPTVSSARRSHAAGIGCFWNLSLVKSV
jgi:hypothetical protein